VLMGTESGTLVYSGVIEAYGGQWASPSLVDTI